MKGHGVKILLVLCCFLLAATELFAQSGVDKGAAPGPANTRTARELFQEADSYLHRKYEEFNRQKLPFDPKLENKTRQEQVETAARNADVLALRSPLVGDDLYCLGMLYHIAGNSDKALEVMRSFVAANPTGNSAQVARAVIVVHAIKKKLTTEAEEVTKAYAANEPLNLQELYGLERQLTEEFYRTKNYRQMAEHAKKMLDVAKRANETKIVTGYKRDEMAFNAASLLAEAEVSMGSKESAVATMEELREFALMLPSGNLYKMAQNRLLRLDANQARLSEDEVLASNPAPELVATEWIGHEPTNLAKLHGQVVLLDFWAPWCGPCLYTFPKLQKWHETYKNKGLVILGVTNYYGNAEGKILNPSEELAYLKQFKTRYRLPYPFVVADTEINDRNYGVSSIPVSFLIDRRGNLRFISVGTNDQEIAGLERMMKRLLDEPAPVNEALSGKVSTSVKNN